MAFDNLPAGIKSWLTFSLTLYSALQPAADPTLGDAASLASSNSTLRYNQIQAIGTHNSYHVTPDDAIIKLLTRSSVRALLGTAAAAQIPSSWEATQAPLGVQIGQYGIRQVELDAYPDPQGDLFRTSAGRKLAGENGFLQIPALARPGWKVLHVPDIDFNTTVWTFVEGLQAIKAYSDANPTHEPIAIYVEFKTDDLSAYIGPLGEQLAPVILNATSTPGPETFIRVRNITDTDVTEMHSEILSVFDGSDIITPDQLRGNASSLKEALIDKGGSGWPTVDSMRGKVLFVVINTFTKQYLAQFPGLRGAIMFTSDIAPHDNSTVFLEPANEQYTSDQVTAAAGRVSGFADRGYMVRVRSDYDTLEARANDTSRVKALAAAGAHFISTDFPSLPTYFNSSYQVRLPTAMVCNPLTTGTGLGNTGNTLGTVDSSSGVPSDATPQCSPAGR